MPGTGLRNLFGQILPSKGQECEGHNRSGGRSPFCGTNFTKNHNWTLVVKIAFASNRSAAKMTLKQILRTHPHWLEEPRFYQVRVRGGHPRGMAVDIAAKDANGHDIDFGTAFDAFRSA